MITAIYYHLTEASNVHWWVEALTFMLDLAIIHRIANW